ncbi:uncharacterized protein MEPE_02058 [Melanopsichium pennsylvanicum]|uniref:Pq loop repeat protein n=2 Tax=Melanopsichium pennsylvanicum TaxID=63383 RepID=A0AAJ4XK91_9BASI|nr:conserved hypothetical protein [Melanopsichium pennsylvanicum 4]SNX83351.1 uncharacterized protein MEPE_02058 [Melanopsichium pennsylvanicum]
MLTLIPQFDRQAISDCSGTLSFCVWLFAQSPQLYENYRRGSVDGLSPVFLTQWMLGDVTNLIGCVLTQQLPFQIAVATYFCCIDVCIMVQFVYYWSKSRKERRRNTKHGIRGRSNSLTSAAGLPSNNPYSVLSETSELLAGRASRHNSFLRSSSKRRNLSHSQHLLPHRHCDFHATLIPSACTDKPLDASRDECWQQPKSSQSRSRNPLPPLSRDDSADATSGSSSVANYRALSEAALSVAQMAQEAARRREIMLHQLANEDYFSLHRKARSHRSKSRASSSPNHSQPPSRTRSRVNSNDFARPDKEVGASIQSLTGAAETNSRRARLAKSMSARTKGVGASVDFVPSALSPTRESRDTDSLVKPARTVGEGVEDESDLESVFEGDAPQAMADSVTSLATVSTEASVESTAEARGRDMIRTASRIPAIAEMRRGGTSSPFSEESSEGTARHASPQNMTREETNRTSMSHRQLGQHRNEEGSDDEQAKKGDSDIRDERRKGRRRRTHNSTRESPPSAPMHAMHRSVDTLTVGGGAKKRNMTRASSSRSYSKRLATAATMEMTSTADSAAAHSTSKKRSSTKSPASMRRSIGMVLLGIMMITTLPPTSTAAAIPSTNYNPLLVALLDDSSAAALQRLVGRISAWLCALLYITSRIPQIWENHIRRSVAGLSILLFIAAFSGNLLYTISVLTNPSASGQGARVYLQESLPFLLGSGGTLIFDLIVVGQWLAWRKNGQLSI